MPFFFYNFWALFDRASVTVCHTLEFQNVSISQQYCWIHKHMVCVFSLIRFQNLTISTWTWMESSTSVPTQMTRMSTSASLKKRSLLTSFIIWRYSSGSSSPARSSSWLWMEWLQERRWTSREDEDSGREWWVEEEGDGKSHRSFHWDLLYVYTACYIYVFHKSNLYVAFYRDWVLNKLTKTRVLLCYILMKPDLLPYIFFCLGLLKRLKRR